MSLRNSGQLGAACGRMQQYRPSSQPADHPCKSIALRMVAFPLVGPAVRLPEARHSALIVRRVTQADRAQEAGSRSRSASRLVRFCRSVLAALLIKMTRPGSLGTDTSGSIILPSSRNNLVGIRVTVGLTSRAGGMAFVPCFVLRDLPSHPAFWHQ